MATARRDDSFAVFVLDQLDGVSEVRSRAMFGDWGLYAGETFFGLIFKGRLYFKTDATSVARYRQRGMRAFKPNPRQRLTTYYEVPAEVLEDRETLLAWADEALRAAHAARRRSPRPTT